MKSTIIVVTLVFTTQAEELFHPVRQELIDEIKSKTNKWQPIEVYDNHFRHVKAEHLYSGLGNRGGEAPITESTAAPNFVESTFQPILNFGKGIFDIITGESALKDDMPAYLVPPGGFPKKPEYMRPKQKMIKGDPSLPVAYNTREAFPYCKP